MSAIPSTTELIHALGLGDRQVGRSHWCDWPPEVQELPDVGRLGAMSKETIVDLRPDLVFIDRSQEDLARSLRTDFGLTVVSPPGESWDEVYGGMRSVADALGVPARGRKLVAHIERSLDAIQKRWAAAPRPRVFVVLDRSAWRVPGRTSFVHRLLEVAGGENVSAALDTESPWPTVTPERIIDWKPSVILDLSTGTDARRSREEAARFWCAHPRIPAVRAGRVFLVEAGVLVRPGPRMAAVAERLAEIIHDTP